jgi:putative spermidine/putrescine transport system ATP-binding protein
MADQIAVMNDGRILQTGGARQLYERPATRFVAGFLGSCNLLPGDRFGHPGRLLGVRPENVRLGAPASGDLALRGHISASTYLGATIRHDVALESGDSVAAICPARNGSPPPAAGEAVSVTWRRDDSFVLDAGAAAPACRG